MSVFSNIIKGVTSVAGTVMSLIPLPGVSIAGKLLTTASANIKTTAKTLDKVSTAASVLVNNGKTLAEQNAIIAAQAQTQENITRGAASASVLSAQPGKIALIVAGGMAVLFLLFKLVNKK